MRSASIAATSRRPSPSWATAISSSAPGTRPTAATGCASAPISERLLSRTAIAADDDVSYAVVVTNKGPSTATHVELGEALPDGLEQRCPAPLLIVVRSGSSRVSRRVRRRALPLGDLRGGRPEGSATTA
jgi:uncharacterized repeat protein (TIGR01451 family)